MISPTELVQLLVANNPQAVRRNLLQNGLVGQSYQVTAEGFMQLLSELPEQLINTREKAINMAASLLNINIDPAGVSGKQLLQMSNSYEGSVPQMVMQTFEQSIPPDLTNPSCGCHAKSFDGSRITILGLAAMGLLFIIVILVKLFLKILN